MSILIDGYNVLFAAGMMPRSEAPGALEQARQWLIRRLLQRLDTGSRADTTIVFDAKDAPRDRPDTYQISGLLVRFARDHEEADDLIEHLIRIHSHPRQLTVVTSDLRLRQLAQRRRAKAIKAEDWLTQTDQFDDEPRPAPAASSNPSSSPPAHGDTLPASEVARWLETFQLADNQNGEVPASAPAVPQSTPIKNAPSQRRNSAPSKEPDREERKERPPTQPHPPQSPAAAKPAPAPRRSDFDWGPFPPGYGEELE